MAGQHGWIIFVATGVFYAQAPPDAVQVLEGVPDRVIKRTRHLPDYRACRRCKPARLFSTMLESTPSRYGKGAP